MDATKHFIKHHQQNVKDDTASNAVSDVYWPNRNTKYLLDTGLLSNDGKPYFGYALCHLYTKTHSNGNSKRYLYCLGVMACQDPKCNFLQRPMQPKSKNSVPRHVLQSMFVSEANVSAIVGHCKFWVCSLADVARHSSLINIFVFC